MSEDGATHVCDDDRTGRPSTSITDVYAARIEAVILYLIFSLELETFVREWLRKLEPILYCDGIFKRKTAVGIFVNVPGEYIFKIMLILCHKLLTCNLELNCRLIL